MADVITRLKLESNEYDSKIKRATQGLLQMEQECRKVGGTLAVLEKDQLEFVKGLGQMETVSKSARGKLSELTQAYTELAMQYKRLTDEEKNGDFGKALSASLEQLKQRIGETKTQLGDITKEMNGGGGLKDALDAVAGKFGLSIDQVTKFGGVVAVTTTAVKVAKDAFFQSESNIDEWGRTVEGAKGAYDVFLQTINNGNWSNFFTNLSTAIQGARDLYDALDRLGSIKSNNQAAIAIVQQQIQQLRLMKQQGQDVDDQLKKATANLAALQKQAVTAGKNAGVTGMQNTIRNGVNSMGGAAVSDRDIQAAIGGILYKGQAEFDKYKETVNKFENWSKAQKVTTQVIPDSQGGTYTKIDREFDINLLTKEQQRQYKLAKAITERETEIQKSISIYAQAVQEGTANAREEFKGNRYALQGSGGSGGSTGGGKTTVTAEKEVTIQQQIAKLEQEAYTASDERRAEIAKQVQELDKVLAAQKAIRDEVHGTVKDQQMATGISGLTPEMLSWGQADIKKQMQTVELGSEEYNNLAQRLIDYNAVSNFMQEAVKSGLEVDDSVKEYFVEALTGPLGENIPQALYDSLVESLNEFKEYAGENPIEIDTKTGSVKETKTKETEKSDQQLQKITSSMSQVISGLQMVGIKVPESVQTALTVIQGAMTLVQGVSSLISIVQSVSVPSQIAAETANTTASVANTAAITALTAAVWANTASSFIPFANGGVVPHAADGYFVGGNRFSGDLTPIMANAGELILNKTQQSTLAQELERGDEDGIGGQPYVTGETIFLGLNNYLKANGYGEVVTTRR
jgi:hypothetical protein